MSEKESGLLTCRNTCWIAGALLGLAAFLLIKNASVLWGLIVGIILAVVVALVLKRLFCSIAGEGMPHHTIARSADVTTGAGASAALDHAGDAHARAAADAAASAMMGDEETASGLANEGGRSTPAAALDAASVRADEPAHTHGAAAPAMDTKPAPKADAKPVADEKPKDKSKGPKTSATKSATASKAPERKPVAKDGKPELFAKPQGEADDLKLIKGVGPKLEALLNSLGVWHFDQIAGWRKKEVEWVDAHLEGFRGRVERDDWIKQAKTLAKGDATEFSKRASKSGMYKK